MTKLVILTALALLAAVYVSPTAEAKGFSDTAGTFQLQLGPATEVDGVFIIPIKGEITDLGGGPWTGSISGSLTLTESHRECGYDYYVGEWTITRGNATPLVERVKGTLISCPVFVGPHLFGSSRAHGPDSGKIIGFRSFDGGVSGSFDTFAGTWSGRFRVN